MLPLALFGMACHNTNPDQGSGGKKVDKQVTLSNDAIVDSTKAILNQTYLLDEEFNKGNIGESDFKQRKTALMTTYQVLYKSLAPSDTLIIRNYRDQKEAEIKKDSTKNSKPSRWE
ncbi:MAG: hypothetical protein EON51_16920 [Acinetobacter sp.]|nr:MAG: hypothetical protein EON51_16920 [Acinetobacter sp.]